MYIFLFSFFKFLFRSFLLVFSFFLLFRFVDSQKNISFFIIQFFFELLLEFLYSFNNQFFFFIFLVMSYVFEDKMEDQADLTQQRLLEMQRERQHLREERQQLNILLFETIDKQNEKKENALRDTILTMNEEIRRLDNILAAAVQGVFFNIYFVFHYFMFLFPNFLFCLILFVITCVYVRLLFF